MRPAGGDRKDRSGQPRTRIRIEDLFEGLEQLLRQTEAIANRTADTAHWTRIADYLTQIRVLLTQLTILDAGPGESCEREEKLKDLAARYFCLEGRIKEMRNDRHSPAQSPALGSR